MNREQFFQELRTALHREGFTPQPEQDELLPVEWDGPVSYTHLGGRSNSYEGELQKAREQALAELQQRASAMGANAVVGVDLDYETLGANGSMLMVTASGTAVLVE